VLIYFHAAIVADSFGALIILCLNGYCQDAVVIARSMFEYALNARYLQQAPLPEVDDYIDFHWVRQKKYYDYLVRFASEDAAKIPASTVQRMKEEFAKVETRFLRKNKKGLRDSWSARSIRERADSVGMGEFYPTFYAMASGLAHGDISGLGARSAKDSLKIVKAPSVSGMKTALQMGHMAFLTTFAVLNAVGGLSLDDDLNKAKDDFLRIWRKP